MIKNRQFVFPILIAVMFFSIIISAGIGPVYIMPGDILSILGEKFFHLQSANLPDWMQSIIIDQRLPRIIIAVIIGASLAVSGALMQALFHNPLADPYIIGVSAGASLGAVVAMVGIGSAFYVTSPFINNNIVVLLSFIGGIISAILVYIIARKNGKVSVATLLLTGIAIGGMMQALTTFIMLQQQTTDLKSIMTRLMGSFSTASWSDVLVILPFAVIGVFLTFLITKQLDILSLGDDEAHHLGINVKVIRTIILVIATLLASISVALFGIIAFVGLIVPHISRLLMGPKHKLLITCSIFLGAILLIWSDAIARSIIPAKEIPIGIITSVIGSIFFLYLLKK